MKLFLNRLSVLTKRSLINPAMYVMSGAIIILALLVIFVPEKDTSVYIPVAVLNEDSSDDTEEIVDDLCSSNSIFHFYEVKNEKELYKDLASGKANTAYIFPKAAVILEPRKIKSDTVSTVTPSISHEMMGPDAMILVF